MDESKLKELSIIDANINRISEGLRVVEDWARFYLRDKAITDELRALRHGLWIEVEGNYPTIIKGRDVGEDILSTQREGTRKKYDDIPKASFNRVKEGFRVLEEMGKVISQDASFRFKEMRFKIYDIEKNFYEKHN